MGLIDIKYRRGDHVLLEYPEGPRLSATVVRVAVRSLLVQLGDETGETRRVVRDTEGTQTQHIAGGRYCWGINVDAPEAVGLSSAERGAYSQTIALKLTHTAR